MIYVASSWRNPRYEGILDCLEQWNIKYYNWRDEEGFHWSDVMDHDSQCMRCSVKKSACLPDGRYYDVCPMAFSPGADHTWEVIEHWTDPVSPALFQQAMLHPKAVAGFHRDMEHLKMAEAVILLLPCGKSAHLEAGWAAGAGKPLALYAPEDLQPELMYGMCQWIMTEIDGLMHWASDNTKERIL